MKRREFLGLSVGGAVVALSPRARAQAPVKEIRIGYQKTGVLVIARQQAILEKHFAAKQIAIKWMEFTSGPPLLEAMSTGSIDLGAVGDSPPIFAQAAECERSSMWRGRRSPTGRAFSSPPIPSIQHDRRSEGQTHRIHQGHQRAQRPDATLEKAGLTYDDITPVYLSPPDAGPAFANGSIEAWAIWDPYFAIGEKKQNGRILINAYEVAKTNSFYLANRDFANANSGAPATSSRALRKPRGGRKPIATTWQMRSPP